MKKIISAGIIFTGIITAFSYNILSADEIYLKDNSVIKCKIIQIADDIVEYDPEGEKPFLTVTTDQVVKIVFDSGHVEYLNKEPEESEAEYVEETPVEEFKEQSGGFIDSVIMISFLYLGNDIWGQLENDEENLFDSYRNQLPDYNGIKSSSISHSIDSYGLEIDFLLPSKKFLQTRGFAITGIKFGFKINYTFSTVEQDITYNGNKYTGTLLNYKSINAGPVMNLVYTPRNNLFSMLVQLYVQGGYIFDGRLNACTGLRDAGIVMNKSDYSANCQGYSITSGVGHYFVMNRFFPVFFGYQLFVNKTYLKFDKKVEVYNNANETSFDQGLGIGISAGVHF